MGHFERSIKIAYDVTGEILDANEIFGTTKESFVVRRRHHEGTEKYYCCECNQELSVSTSKYDRLHFKHKPNADYCILKDGNLSPEQLEQFTTILAAKESERHKDLKNKIGERLRKVEGVDVSSIAIDNKFIIRGDEKRRPDVYCKYNGKEIVFEIQLADLSLRYILSRYKFYQKHGMYLIWILDNFDVRDQGQLERDIKYLTNYQNFFKLDETTEEFRLRCEYKFPFLTPDNKLLTKWVEKSVGLSQLTFDSEAFQAYYYNYGDQEARLKENQSRIAAEMQEAERQKVVRERLATAKSKVQEIVAEIRKRKQSKSLIYDSVIQRISELDDYEINILNETLELGSTKPGKKPAITQWIEAATKEDGAFIQFILNCSAIVLDVNQVGPDGITAFQALYQNKDLINKYYGALALFKRGYKLTQNDETFYLALPEPERDKSTWASYQLFNRLSDRGLVDAASNHSKLLYIIESAKQKTFIGYGFPPNAWVAFANNAIEYHSAYWEYLELAFNYYKLWSIIIQLDRKGTFQGKVQKFYANMPKQKYDFDEVFRDLYPELANE